MKAILVILDGLGDRPIKEFKGLTPLEAARTPNLDELAESGITGLMDTAPKGVYPGSAIAHSYILGYDVKKYYPGRGPIEVLGIGLDLKKEDVAFRANIGFVDENWMVKDRRCGRIESTKPFAKALDGLKIDGIKFLVKPGTAYRMGIIMRGKGLSAKVSPSDPHKTGVKVLDFKPLAASKAARFTANVLNKFLKQSHEILKELPFNKRRVKQDLMPGNFVLMRGAGSIKHVPSFKKMHGLKAACIAGAGLYKGIGRLYGMKLIKARGANGLPSTNVKAKFKAAKKALKKFDFIFVHVKAADSLGEDGNFKGKKKFIEKIDRAFPELMNLKKTLLIVTADHSTPCALKKHSSDPVPLLLKNGLKPDRVKSFGEHACAQGALGRIFALKLMTKVKGLLAKKP